MKFTDLKPDLTVYDAHKHKMGNTTMRTWGVWSVRIISVNQADQTVTASWNSNPEQVYSKSTWSKWRKVKPMMVKSGFGQRLATRDEIKAIKTKATL